MKKKLVILISGNGSNLQAIIDAVQSGQVEADISLVLSNKANAYGLERARKANIESKILSNKGFNSRESYDSELISMIDQHQPDLVVLAGFMRILSKRFVDHYA